MLYNMFNFQSNDNWDTDGLYWYNEFYTKKPVWTGLNQFHGPQNTGPRWSSSVPTISGSVLDWLWSMVACFGGKKPDWTRLVNTTRIYLPKWVSANADTWFAINNNPQLSSSSTTIIYDAHQHCITMFTHSHHRPQHSSTTHNNHSTLQHNNNAAMPHHQPNEYQWGQHDMMSVVWQWWCAMSSLSGCFRPPWWVNNHLTPPLLTIQVPCCCQWHGKWVDVDSGHHGHHNEQPPRPPMPRCHVAESNVATKQWMAMMDRQCSNMNDDEGPPTNGDKHTQCSNMNGDKGPPPPPLMNGNEDPPPLCTNSDEWVVPTTYMINLKQMPAQSSVSCQV